MTFYLTVEYSLNYITEIRGLVSLGTYQVAIHFHPDETMTKERKKFCRRVDQDIANNNEKKTGTFDLRMHFLVH